MTRPVVVADSTGFILFARAKRFSLLTELLSPFEVLTPPRVFDEVAGPGTRGRPGYAQVRRAAKAWLHVEAPAGGGFVPAAAAALGMTDVDVLALAIQRGAVVYSDDGPLRREADGRGVKSFGSLGLIARHAKTRMLTVRSALETGDALLGAGLRIRTSVYATWRSSLDS